METIDERFREAARTTRIDGVSIDYVIARVLPETVSMLRDVLREVERLWVDSLGAEEWARLNGHPRWGELSQAVAGLEIVPPGREMVVVRIAVPVDLRTRIKRQLLDAIEPDEHLPGAPESTG